KTAPHADATSLSRAWDSSEVAVLQRHMDDFYDRFLSRVAAGRKLTKAAADSLAQGRIFTGTQAVGNGLADRIGGLEDAVAEAARLAGIPENRNVEVEPVPGRQGAGRIGGAWSMLRDPAGAEESGALASLTSWADRYKDLSEGQMLAVSPELSGWIGSGLR
ncbi:MAG TPA: S49 family peptidase, partial [Fibrobacteria bacterium]|nr:S49 family peptidase [Fibrobacteria bacterium]